MLSEAEIIPELSRQIQEAIRLVRSLTVVSVETEVSIGEASTGRAMMADLVVRVENRRGQRTSLIVEAKSVGQPSTVRMAASQLWAMIRRKQDAYGIVGIPFASTESRRVCLEMDVGLIDLAGNCLLRFDDVYISVEGKKNPHPATRPLRKPFARKSTRAVRTLLCNPGRKWTAVELASTAGISTGLSYNLLKRLLELELIEASGLERGRTFFLSRPERLLREWAQNYSYRKNNERNYYSPDDVYANESNLVRFCDEKQIRYAFTLTSGAAKVATALRYNRAYAYVERDWDKIAQALGWKEVRSGPNVTLLEPYDDGVFSGLQKIDGMKVVCAPQLYIDLQSYKGRGEEAAEAVLEQVLRKQWQRK